MYDRLWTGYKFCPYCGKTIILDEEEVAPVEVESIPDEAEIAPVEAESIPDEVGKEKPSGIKCLFKV